MEGNFGKQQEVDDSGRFAAERIIMRGLQTAGIEYDKIPDFSKRLREVSQKLFEISVRTEKIKTGDENARLLAEIGRTNPHNDAELVKARIVQFIGSEIGVPITKEIIAELRILVSDIVDDEIKKHLKRKNEENL